MIYPKRRAPRGVFARRETLHPFRPFAVVWTVPERSVVGLDYLVIGGDARFARLAEQLEARGKRALSVWNDGGETVDAGILALRGAANIVVNYPPKLTGVGMTFEEIMSMARDDVRVFACGPWHPDRDQRIVDLWNDGALIAENARLTAEGAVSAAMEASELAMRDARCLVIGWGRIGRALTEILVGLGARVTVASRSAASRNRAAERGADAVRTDDLKATLSGADIVFNTAPAMVLDEDALSGASPGTLMIDLASAPYGIDLRAAWRRGIRAWREPGLPGRYCPRSAAKALAEAIARHGL